MSSEGESLETVYMQIITLSTAALAQNIILRVSSEGYSLETVPMQITTLSTAAQVLNIILRVQRVRVWKRFLCKSSRCPQQLWHTILFPE